MKYTAIMLLAFVLTSCFVRKEQEQMDGFWAELVDIKIVWRLQDREYKKYEVFIYETPRGEKEVSYPIDNNRVIGSKHFIPIRR